MRSLGGTGLRRPGLEGGAAFTLLTTEPGPDVVPIQNNRQVLVLQHTERSTWLDLMCPEAELLQPLPAGSLRVPGKRDVRLHLRDCKHHCANLPISMQVITGEKHAPGHGSGTANVAQISQSPGSTKFREFKFLARPGHHHQIVAGEPLGAADRHQYEPE